MSLDTTIKNVGDYYAAHYLADKNGFAKDIADKTAAWKNQGSSSVVKKLQALSDKYFKAKSRALDYPGPQLRTRAKTDEIDSWHSLLLNALGYQPEPFMLELQSEKQQLPALLRLHRHTKPWLVICETAFCLSDGDNDEQPLETDVIPRTHHIEGWPTFKDSWEKAVSSLFQQEDRPRWLILLAGSRIYLFDSHTLAQGRYLYIDLDDAFGRKQTATFEAICALLAKDALAPESETDEVLHERLREGSLKSTHGVSAKLQVAVRDAIETLANGWVDARRLSGQGYRQLSEREAPLPNGSRDVTAEQLRHDALIYVYRLLFCLYAEARGGELGILPISDDIYRLGYSLEALRDLVEQTEPTTSNENGHYFAEHLDRLFNLIHIGFHPEQNATPKTIENDNWKDFAQLPIQGSLFDDPPQQQLVLETGKVLEKSTQCKTFVISPLTATLFAPDAMPLLHRVKLPNRILHKVIRCLSLGTGEKSKRVGRINYAELGIVQLGAVYEGLLSYKGFFAREDLIQVVQKPKGGKIIKDNAIPHDVATWFVPKTRESEFKKGEVVLEHRTEQPRIYKTGEFILHLNGVDRVNSASYYTPEVLTRCLVQEALKERLKNIGPDEADSLLEMKICEPAMGSAAFMVEAVDQLAHEYLRLKQIQTGKTIDPSNYEDELRRTRHYIAVHNVYGVDLNPTAVELGALSLWLTTIHRLKVKTGENGTPDEYRPGATPWFGLRLRAGNSLIGARRAVWSEEQLITGKFFGKKAEAPRQLKPGENRKKGEIYHFLVWDEDMCPAADDKLMKSYWGNECAAIREWRKEQVKKRWTPEDISRARNICEQIDALWEDYASHREKGLKGSECTATVWPEPTNSLKAIKTSPALNVQESIKAKLESNSGAFRRLKLMMDAWCSFYFWPLTLHAGLPSRQQWLAAGEILLGCESASDEATSLLLKPILGDHLEHFSEHSSHNLPDTTELANLVPWFDVAQAVSNEQHFHHWELIFTEILGPATKHNQPHGFDLMFGNPPWMKVTWKDAPLLSEFEPLLGVRNAKSAKYNSERNKLLRADECKITYRDSFTSTQGSNAFLNDRTMYPALAGVQTNLYKNFIERSWKLLGYDGIAALLHPEGVFDDPKGGNFREAYYPRLSAHYQLKNELTLFQDVHHVMSFSINIYSGIEHEISFKAIFNLFTPQTISRSTAITSLSSEIPGIKSDEGKWETRGHPLRIITITKSELTIFTRLYEEDGTPPTHSRLPQIHSLPLLKVLEKFAAVPQRLGDLKEQYLATEMFHESNAQKNGVITRSEKPTYQPKSAEEWVISGPHFYVGNPLNKTPRTTCTANGHYDTINLESISDDYLPRAVYRPGDKDGNLDEFYAAIPEWPKPSKPVRATDGSWIPGFWPVEEYEIPAWELLLGESLVIHGIDPSLPGAKTARKFGYFSEWHGDVLGAISWLVSHMNSPDVVTFRKIYPDVKVRHILPTSTDMINLPKPLTSYYRYLNRKRAQPANERTLMPSLIPPGPSHIHAAAYSIALPNVSDIVLFSAMASTVLFDFFVKVTGRTDIIGPTVSCLPLINNAKTKTLITARYLRLNCLTRHYDSLYKENYNHRFNEDAFSKNIFLDRIIQKPWNKLKDEWCIKTPLRNELVRRQAQLEIDVLVAIELGVTVNELIQVYSTQFPIMKAYEEADQYDAKGRRLPNTIRKDSGAKELRNALKNHDDISPITVSWEIDNGNQLVTRTFYPPFHHVDRIEDYKTAYRVFSERVGINQPEKEIA
ncbi:hypothetical protein [uncultured Photobacterium sp.]|uniref:Eco57I restriction-modification methylase domain-containing protein n=1 Tax=uncultured Photobacterium sp. TaxID=173973 RepID=UPI0026317292|nr:hypothetical protein [uncultured Photobacterium sp.]